MNNIYLTTWTFTKGKGKLLQVRTANNIVVTGNNKTELMQDVFYKKRALFSIDIKKDHADWTVKDIQIVKQIGTPTNY